MKNFLIVTTFAHYLLLGAVIVSGNTFESNTNGYIALVVSTVAWTIGAITYNGKKKYIACCSADLSAELVELGIPNEYVVCPYEGRMSMKFFLSNLKRYKYMLFDGNPTVSGEVGLHDLQEAIRLANQGVPIILRVDESAYVAAGLHERLQLLRLAITNTKVQELSTGVLARLIKKYYGIKSN